MSENKTKENDQSVTKFLQSVEHDRKREDGFALLELFQEVTGEEPKMWGDTIIGFGKYHYKYESGREGDAMLAGFSPRKQNLALYIMAGVENYPDLLEKLGKHKTGKSCLYINKLDDVDTDVLKEMVRLSVKHMRETNPS